LKDVNHNLLKKLERFFISYNETRGKTFRLLAARGPKRASTPQGSRPHEPVAKALGPGEAQRYGNEH
jgi:hypothetical protein